MKFSTVDAFKKINDSSGQLIHINGEILKRYQQILYNIAKDIIEVCEEENIVYFLLGGSTLGAVRHKGFIPWDDDIDIGILSNDFDKFINVFKSKYSNRYWVHTYDTHEYGMLVSRIRLKNSICRTREDVGNEECGFFIDIFRIENTFNNPILRGIHGVMCMGMGFLLSCRNFYKNKDLMLKLSEDNKNLRRTFLMKIDIGWFLRFLTIDQWTKLTQRCYGLCKNSKSKYVTIPAGRKHYFREMMFRKDFMPPVTMDFEDCKWNVPRNYKKYLSNMYGDYTKIPAENDREEHVLLELVFPEDYK